MSRSIGKALSDDAFDGAFGALYVIYAETNAIGTAEIKLAQIAVQMLLCAALIDAFHAALEDRIVAFDGIGMDVAANIFLFRMERRLRSACRRSATCVEDWRRRRAGVRRRVVLGSFRG